MYSAVSSSTTLLCPSGSKSSLLSGSGYADPYGNRSSRKRLEVIGKASTPNLHLTSTVSSGSGNPSEYSIPGVQPGTHVTYAVAGARIYHNTQQTTQSNHTSGNTVLNFGLGNRSRSGSKDKSQWVYSYLKGTLVFGQDRRPCAGSVGLCEEDMMAIERITGSAASRTTSSSASSSRDDDGARGDYWFQLVDDETEKVVWRFKVPPPPSPAAAVGNTNRRFKYEFDRPFFHVFQGSSRKYGFLFDDDREANVFLNEVTSRVVGAVGPVSPPAKTMMTLSLPRNFSIRSKKSRNASPSSSPSPPVRKPSATIASFKQLTHIGFNQTNNGNSSMPLEIQ